MASPSAASWIVAACIGAVEALKDQVGLCRWDYALRSLHQRAKSRAGSLGQVVRRSAPSTGGNVGRVERAKLTERTLEKVMYLSCYGPK